jgi:hypothetical protein
MFPIDAAKTRQQLVRSSADGQPRGIVAGLQALRRKNALYKGFGPVALRAIPVHMCYLPIYDAAMSWLAALDCQNI